MTASKNAPFVWYELMTNDLAAAEKFYTQVVGWTARDAGVTPPYTLLLVGTAQVAGMMPTPPAPRATGVPPAWAGYIGVDDVDVMLAQALRAGAKVLRPADDIPEVGRFAVLADPQGAAFMLFRPCDGDPPPSPPPGTPGTVAWHELHAGDGPAAFEFYAGLFGWARGDALDMGDMGTYQLFSIDGVPAGGVMTKMPDVPAPSWNYYIVVDDIHAAAARVRVAGGQVRMGPHQVPGGSWIINAVDPQGVAFSLIQQPPVGAQAAA